MPIFTAQSKDDVKSWIKKGQLGDRTSFHLKKVKLIGSYFYWTYHLIKDSNEYKIKGKSHCDEALSGYKSAAELVGHLYLSEIPEPESMSSTLLVSSKVPLGVVDVLSDFARFDPDITITNADRMSFVLKFSKPSQLEAAKKAIEEGTINGYTLSS